MKTQTLSRPAATATLMMAALLGMASLTAVAGGSARAPMEAGMHHSDAAHHSAPSSSAGKAAKSGINDAQIAAIVVTANTIDSDAGKLALERASNPEVKKFAQQMVSDHNGVNQAAVDLVTRLNVTPEENATSRSLKADAQKTQARLQKLSGAEFDRAYMDNEVAYHQAVISAVDSTLIPNAQNADLKAMLIKVRPAFVAHLEQAKQIRKSLGN